VATLLPEAAFVGSYGSMMGKWNQNWFGYISYIYPFVLILPALFFYRDTNVSARRVEIFLSITLLVFATLMFQAVVIDSNLNGYLGFSIVAILDSFIGKFGVWLFIIAIASLAVGIILDSTAGDMFSSIKFKLPKREKFDTAEDEEYDEVENPIETTKNEDDIAQEDVNPEDFDDTIKLVKKEESKVTELKEKVEVKKEPEHKVEILNEVEENKKLLDEIEKGEQTKPKDYKLPPLSILTTPPKKSRHINEAEIDQKISDLLDKLKRFKIDGDVVLQNSSEIITYRNNGMK